MLLRSSLVLLVLTSAAGLRLPSSAACARMTRQHCLALFGSHAAFAYTSPALAKYGEFAKTSGGQDQMAVGDSSNECMFAQPGTGIVCTPHSMAAAPTRQRPTTPDARFRHRYGPSDGCQK